MLEPSASTDDTSSHPTQPSFELVSAPARCHFAHGRVESMEERSSSCSLRDGKKTCDAKGSREGLSRSNIELSSSTANQVDWDVGDPENPKNWTRWRKWGVTLIVSAFAFISPLSSSISAPALSDIGEELDIPEGYRLQMVLSIFMLSYAVAPLVLSPCSEMFGRTPIIRFSNLIFVAFNTACGFSRTEAQLTVFRLLAGFGGSATQGMGGAMISDCWHSEERGRGISIYQLGPLLGPAIGPFVGGFIVEHTSWRWTFWVTSIVNILIQILGYFFLRETYGPRLLALKARRLRHETGNVHLHTVHEARYQGFSAHLLNHLTRPWKLFFTKALLMILAIHTAYNYGTIYLIISTAPNLWKDHYHFSPSRASLHYLSLALGTLLGSQLFGPVSDRLYRRITLRYAPTTPRQCNRESLQLSHSPSPPPTSRTEYSQAPLTSGSKKGGGGGKRRGGSNTSFAHSQLGGVDAKPPPPLPLARLPLVPFAALLTPLALLLFALTAAARTPVPAPDVGVFFFGFGSVVAYLCLQTYIVEAFGIHAASAAAGASAVRNLAAVVVPLWGRGLLIGGMGWAKGGALMAGIGGILGLVAVGASVWFGWIKGVKTWRKVELGRGGPTDEAEVRCCGCAWFCSDSNKGVA
ncbi:major facilitator superfamily domain-containing protein [Phyllosticta citricarpa]|uniref:Major facilitator superfamily domain-containing protein n=1 Tax=Phyllosticta citricarpa TaxID=55181 RepID=A0ABR1LKF8_9PEZI